MRIIHLSDVHVWRYSYNPLHLLNKRLVGVATLLAGRAANFRLERLSNVVERIEALQPDHLLITGDLTTTALPAEFRAARAALGRLLVDPGKVSVIPGNHDRYTSGSVRSRAFEEYFGVFGPTREFPWLRSIGDETTIVGLDPTRSHLSARGLMPLDQLEAARSLILGLPSPPKRLIVACHYPVIAPPSHAAELEPKRMRNAPEVAEWLRTLGPHLFCCGHVHAAWCFAPAEIPGQLCLNAGAPLMRDPTGLRPPGFLEIELNHSGVSVLHHAWVGQEWAIRPLCQDPSFFENPGAVA